MSRNGKILVALLGVLMIAIIYRILNPFQQQTIDKFKYTGSADRDRTPSFAIPSNDKKKLSNQEVLIDLLINPPHHSDKTVKNIFTLPLVQPQQLTENIVKSNDSEKSESAATEKSDPFVLANEDIHRFSVFGVFKTNKEKMVFLEKGKDVLIVREGDRVDGKYRVEHITDQEVIFKAENLNASIKIAIQDM